jgi:nitrogen fixation NifU-like protein
MTDKVKGLSVNESKNIFKILHLLITENKVTNMNKKELGKLLVFSSIVDFPMRIKCVTLAWHVMRSAIRNKE